MRKKSECVFQFYVNDSDENLPSVVKNYRSEYKKINELLLDNQPIVEAAHEDLVTLSKSSKGRISSFSSESLFRALLIKQKEGLTYREACIRISESSFLKDFCFFPEKSGLDYTLLCKAFNAITPETWQLMNQLLANSSIKNNVVDIDVIRTDSTVVETNVHWPTDSSLLWDVYRVIERILGRIRKYSAVIVPFRFHINKIKSLHVFVTRYASSSNKKRKKQVRRKMKKLIERVEAAITNANIVLKAADKDLEVISSLEELESFLPSMKTVASCARRRWIDGEEVPVEDKIFSIFEPHTELIMRGRREKPVEIGHKIVINQSKEKFITNYLVLEKKLDDRKLLEIVIEQHEEHYGKKPKALAADKGFLPDSDTFDELSEEIDFLSIPRCNRDYSEIIISTAQRFRAGIEGSISCLKRAFRLSKCFFKGFKNFSSAIGSAILCHNLVVLSQK